MSSPQAARKHDGRVVAFDLERLTTSLLRAAWAGGEHPGREACSALAAELARAVAEFLVREYSATPSTADIRELVLRLLRETGHPRMADAFADHARATASLLWRLRVVENDVAEGTPWDRRRLIESLRASGIARDPAGELARDVERRLAVLGEDRVSTALLHALAVLKLTARGLDPRRYAARRVAVSFSGQSPRYDPAAAGLTPLPPGGPALEAFWLQAVHSPEVAAAARNNHLALEPYPHVPASLPAEPAPLDPLAPDAAEWHAEWAAHPERPLAALADRPERLAALARLLACAAPPGRAAGTEKDAEGAEAKSAGPGAEVHLILQPRPEGLLPRTRSCAAPITLNVGGVLVREALREQQRATSRLARLVTLAAQAHREREEYWGFSPVRGRELPLAAAGLWNASAWLQGQGFERPGISLSLRLLAGTLVSVLHGAVATVREETGLLVTLVSDGPPAAGAALWRRDREYFARDGLQLDPAGAYALGLELRIAAGVPELNERIEFLRSVAPLFDDPPVLRLDAPLGQEPDVTLWQELLQALAQSGVPRARLSPGGSSRGARLLARLIRAHLEGYPLFEQPA
jgi:hypothetical protein